ncbi:MAG: hypothetical protein M1836_000421 [Candelina mexicana]|nr:MAG: hypothetical protein M1836_000421 [Candelina mexicana]
MADTKKATDGPSPYADLAYDPSRLPDFYTEFVPEADIEEFARALSAPEHGTDDTVSPQKSSKFITALNDWRPIHQRVRGRRKRNASHKRIAPRRGKDETREGFVYSILKWPLLGVVFGWLFVLGLSYLVTRLYIYFYEHLVTWRGERERLRKELQSKTNFSDWVKAAKELDTHLGNVLWKEEDEYAYYDHKTVRRVNSELRRLRTEAEEMEYAEKYTHRGTRAIDDLRGLTEACVKSNFAGVENPRLYSETYYGTKNLVQQFIDEVELSLSLLLRTHQLTHDDKRRLFKHIHTNFGRTALCFSGGASFAYYHFGVVKALLDANLIPEVITGTSGGALVAALVATRTDAELKQLLVPALAGRINACHDQFFTWFRRWYRTGARFDALDWARQCSWFCRGSMTFREAYERTGRILNVSCVPSDPHSPTILTNYLTSPDCVIWSAVLASAAVPGILNPVVLMKKANDGTLVPYSFGHKWKDGSLRTDIPLRALNLHFNVNFSIVSQVNPHINIFFFSSRGTVGRPVTHRRGRGWRGGFLGSATEQYLKLDLNKWLKVLRHLELLPRPLGQDWSELWLQRFSGTITIWPKSVLSDFYYILSDPTPQRLARMLHVGQQSTFPKLKFIANRMKAERLVEEGRRMTRPPSPSGRSIHNILSEEDLQGLLRQARRHNGVVAPPPLSTTAKSQSPSARPRRTETSPANLPSPSLSKRFSGWWSNRSSSRSSVDRNRSSITDFAAINSDDQDPHQDSSTIISEIGRQSRVFLDDSAVDGDSDDAGSSGTTTAEEEDWEVEEEKDKIGMDEEREMEEDAVQKLEDDGKGTFVG